MSSSLRDRPGPPGRIEGARAVIEAIRAGRRAIHEVSLPQPASSPALRELEALALERGIPIRQSERSASAPAVVARADPYGEVPFEELLMHGSPRLLVALDRVTDVGNLGSIARSAESAGATGMILEYRRAAAVGPGALRSSAGALEHLQLGRAPSLSRALDTALEEGLTVFGADMSGQRFETLPTQLLRGDLIWVFGSEDRGLRPSIRERATHLVGIPLAGRIASLGVAAAAAYLLHRTAEARRNVS